MITRCRPCSAASRRHFARISRTPIDGVSSMKIFASLSVPIACDSLPQSRLAEKAAAQPVRVDARLGGQHAEEQLLLRHLEAEDADRHVGLGADVLGDVQHQAGLPHRRPGRDDDQVGRLQAGRHLVEIGEAGGDAGDQLLARVQLLDRVEAGLREVAQRDEAVADLVVGDGEDRVLGLVEDDVGVLLRLVGRREDLVGREDQVPEGGLLLDDPRVVLDVGRARHAVDQRGDVGRTADLVELAGSPELLLQRDQIDRVAALREPDHLLEDAAVRVAEEIGASITSAARLKASLFSRIAPSTERSASRLCGSVRSATARSGI